MLTALAGTQTELLGTFAVTDCAIERRSFQTVGA